MVAQMFGLRGLVQAMAAERSRDRLIDIFDLMGYGGLEDLPAEPDFLTNSRSPVMAEAERRAR
ncbi:hypothetical protein [Radicibacter daui]|uniref:hypothetical protein n=1 Tax=Radicibacter daui TaxID=3064829 RepID=UPI0040469D9C